MVGPHSEEMGLNLRPLVKGKAPDHRADETLINCVHLLVLSNVGRDRRERKRHPGVPGLGRKPWVQL